MSKEEFFILWDELHAGIPKDVIKKVWDVDEDVMNYINSPEFLNSSPEDQKIIEEVIEGLK
jgi:hypothetical protein